MPNVVKGNIVKGNVKGNIVVKGKLHQLARFHHSVPVSYMATSPNILLECLSIDLDESLSLFISAHLIDTIPGYYDFHTSIYLKEANLLMFECISLSM